MHSKDETFQAFKNLEMCWENIHGIKIKILHSDGGGEYKSHEFDNHLANKGIQCRFTVHDMPEHNGVAERLNHTLLEKVRAMLHTADLAKNLWGEALKHAVWLKNRTSTKVLNGRTPYEAFKKEKPDLHNIHEWGCKVDVQLDDAKKLDGCAREG
jgi:transposase InsO family protein